MNLTTLIIFCLATWRLASLLANEGGPLDVFAHIRKRAGVECPEGESECFGRNWFANGLVCEWCNSVWIGTALTLGWWLFGEALTVLLLPFAFSAGAILLKYIVQNLQKHLDT